MTITKRESKILEENLDCNPDVYVAHTINEYVSYPWTSEEVDEVLWDAVQDNIIRIYQEHRLEERLWESTLP